MTEKSLQSDFTNIHPFGLVALIQITMSEEKKEEMKTPVADAQKKDDANAPKHS